MSNSLFGKGYSPSEASGSRQLPAGGYICRIMGAKIGKVKSTGLPMIVVQFDISEGEYSNFFHDKYATALQFNPQAAYRGIANIPAIDENGNQRRGFNSFCGAVEKSNDIKLPQEDTAFLNSLRNMMVGIIFGREQYEGNDGNLYWSAKPRFYRSVETIMSGNYTVPDDKYLDERPPQTTASDVSALFGDVPVTEDFSATNDPIPF